MINYTQILVAEDEAIVAKDVSNRLRNMGYAVPVVAPTGEEAVEQANALRPDLVLMDIRLKGTLDGIEAATQIRRQQDVPIIYLTAYADDDTVARAQLTEPAGYLLKPFVERELQTTIEMALYRHRGERRVHAREQWFANTLRSIAHGVVVTDESGRVNFMNGAAEDLLGATFASSLGRLMTDLFQLEDARTGKRLTHPMLQVLQNGEETESERAVLRKPDSGTVPIQYSVAPVRDNAGSVTGLVMILARGSAEVEKDSRAAAFDVSVDCLFILDREGRVTLLNTTAHETLGWTRDALQDKPLADLVLGPSWRSWLRRELAHSAATGEGPCLGKRVELTALRADGTEFPAEFTFKRLDLAEPPTFVAFLRDITERKQEEQRLDAHIRALQENLTRSGALNGIIPVCSWCKKIRDQNGAWIPMERYFQARTGAMFSHGYCPDCADSVMTEFRERHGHAGGPPAPQS